MLLERKGVNYTDIRVDLDPALRHEMIQRSHGHTSVPQIFIGATHVGGCDEMYALEQQGQLDPLLHAHE